MKRFMSMLAKGTFGFLMCWYLAGATYAFASQSCDNPFKVDRLAAFTTMVQEGGGGDCEDNSIWLICAWDYSGGEWTDCEEICPIPLWLICDCEGVF